MKIEIITTWYNEEFLAPFFLEHYNYADRISILYDQDSSDNTESICQQYDNVRLIPFRFPDMMDDEIKIKLINDLYKKSDADWVLSVDADEFVFIKRGDVFIYDLREFIEANLQYNMYLVSFYQVYRHRSDSDLEPNLPAVPQRRHGDPNISTGINALYNKPVLVKSGLDITWTPGCHSIEDGEEQLVFAQFAVPGAHWAMADPGFCLERRMKYRKGRQSKNNLQKKLTVHQHAITIKDLMTEFKQHLNDPQLF